MRGGNIIWILFLLAALFLGPTYILKRMSGGYEPPQLRAVIAQEKLVDAPADIPPAKLDKR